jgi:transcriptional regulator with XRE-family HTH domain
LKHYKTRLNDLRRLSGFNIKDLAKKLGCRRESIYYALRTKGTKSELKKTLDKILEDLK